ncbi:hypothetical protein ACFOMD_07690 [Sphingoaurantiacus capsulatus]|uniref:Uncharacterized protein n=1 Tax=Sphingoaurantiacus capsulatus TaxID=1771310 RepID=A0ABV7X960_9SPHN
MRPKTIMLFEQLYLLAILVEVVRIALQWQLAASAPADVWIRIAAVVISLALVLLASRARKRIAGIVLAALFVIGLPTVATVFQAGLDTASKAFIVVQVVLQAAAILLFFAPASRAWYAGR